MKAAFVLALLPVTLAAQTSDETDVARLTRQLRSAIERDELTPAADLAGRLDEAVQARQRAWLIRDVSERVDDALHWLPVDTESFWVNQEPFTIRAEEPLSLLYARPAQVYAIDRLSALNEGAFSRALTNRTVRLAIAGGRKIGLAGGLLPAPTAAREVAYFLFFTEPVELASADESIKGRPVWRGVAKRMQAQPDEEPQEREEENWIALPRPDLLVLTNNKELLGEILERIVRGSKTRALPAALPEWNQVDRRAPFWGLRHYTGPSKPKPGERGFEIARLPDPDGAAVGVAMQFDTAQQRLEIRYLSAALRSREAGRWIRSTASFASINPKPESGGWSPMFGREARSRCTSR